MKNNEIFDYLESISGTRIWKLVWIAGDPHREDVEKILDSMLDDGSFEGNFPDIPIDATKHCTQFGDLDDKKLTAAVDIYVSDFGTHKVVPNRFQRARTGFVLESEKWAVAYLRPFQTEALAKTGDSDAKQIVVEYTLEARNEASSGAARDLS